MSAGFALLQRFIRETSGFVLDQDKRYLLDDRLSLIIREAKLSGLDDLAQHLHRNRRSELARRVTEAVTINETSFFRDRALFAAFADELLPGLVAARQHRRQLRIWCAGCSTGQEPYSIAMLLEERARQLSGWQIEILATDLSRAVIESAQRGRYSQFEVQRGLPVAMLLRHFTRVDDLWQVSDHLRAKITFRVQNLIDLPRDPERFDAIFCRNVLFYFDAVTKRRVLDQFADRLEPDGFLALGGAERIGAHSDALIAASNMPFVFGLKAPALPGRGPRPQLSV